MVLRPTVANVYAMFILDHIKANNHVIYFIFNIVCGDGF